MTIKVTFGEETREVKRKPNRSVADPNAMLGQPYVRALPNGFQMALGRDALIALGRPKRVNWEVEADPAVNAIFVKLIPTSSEDGFLVSYSREGKAGIITIPKIHQSLFSPKARYDIVSWSPHGERHWAKVSIVPQFDKQPVNLAPTRGNL